MNTDITWLPNHLLKDIDLPKVIIEEYKGQSYSGYYRDGTKKLIVVETSTIVSTIAHEFCHYLQYTKNTLTKNNTSFFIEDTYEKSIKKFFRNDISEYEALLFEHKYAKDWLNDWWLRKLVLE